MSQNTSSAVMQQRSEPDDSLDDFPTQPWATRALIKHIIEPILYGPKMLRDQSAWEPTCNRGHMVDPLRESFGQVWASDIFDYGYAGQNATFDFLMPLEGMGHPVDWVFFNPPFRLAEQFLARAQTLRIPNIAMIVRTAFLEGVARYQNIYRLNPPTIVAQYVERVPMVKGRLTAKGSTATAYCWLLWCDGLSPGPMQWIPPCRKQLERPEDYAGYAS